MEAKSKITLLISNREGTVKRAIVKKAIAAAYAKTGLDPIWNGRVSKKIIKIK